MSGLIISNIFSLLVHQQWVVAGALAAVRHAGDSEKGRFLLASGFPNGHQPRRAAMKRTRLNTKRMLKKMRVSRIQQHLTDAWQTKWAA